MSQATARSVAALTLGGMEVGCWAGRRRGKRRRTLNVERRTLNAERKRGMRMEVTLGGGRFFTGVWF
jgi:hypothetical protein